MSVVSTILPSWGNTIPGVAGWVWVWVRPWRLAGWPGINELAVFYALKCIHCYSVSSASFCLNLDLFLTYFKPRIQIWWDKRHASPRFWDLTLLHELGIKGQTLLQDEFCTILAEPGFVPNILLSLEFESDKTKGTRCRVLVIWWFYAQRGQNRIIGATRWVVHHPSWT